MKGPRPLELPPEITRRLFEDLRAFHHDLTSAPSYRDSGTFLLKDVSSEVPSPVVKQGKPFEDFHIRRVTNLGIAVLKHGSCIPAQCSLFRLREQDLTVY